MHNKIRLLFSVFLLIIFLSSNIPSVWADDNDPPPPPSDGGNGTAELHINVDCPGGCSGPSTQEQSQSGENSSANDSGESNGSSQTSEEFTGPMDQLDLPGIPPSDTYIQGSDGAMTRVLTSGAGITLEYIQTDKAYEQRDYPYLTLGGSLDINNLQEHWDGISAEIPPSGYHNGGNGPGIIWSCPSGVGYKASFSGGVLHQEFTYTNECTTSTSTKYTNTGGGVPMATTSSSTSCITIKHPIPMARNSGVCKFNKQGGVRWWDSYDERHSRGANKVTATKGAGLTFYLHYYSTTVFVPYPCPTVIRNPYPRGIAGQPNEFRLQKDEFITTAVIPQSCSPDIHDYKVEILLKQNPGYLPLWSWNDRPWSKQPTTARGWDVFHIFDTASYDLWNTLGPGLTEEKLPAYNPVVQVKWDVFMRRSWTDHFSQGQATPWEYIDLTTYGFSTPNFIMQGSKDVTPPPPGVPLFNNPKCTVPVPVVESQGLVSSSQ